MYLHDGTYVPVARIQGSPECQAFMRKTTGSSSTEDSTLCQWLSPTIGRLPLALGLAVDICLRKDVATIKTLLAALNSAVESYLGTNICFASLSLDVATEKKIEVAEEALNALGLTRVLPTIQSAKHVILAHRPATVPEPDEEWIVLAVDFSIRWYNIGLYAIEQLGIVDPVDDFVRGPRIDEDNQLDALRDTLSHLIANPPPNVRLPEQIHHLVVYGDDSENETFHNLLAELLGADLVRDARVSNSVFDGPKVSAYVVHENMDTVDFEMNVKSAFGCQWRSKLYPGYQTTSEL
tara:strand:- start:125 stop:1006 length:882 start_codon:yes stop_codon:yes gene_type:complete